MRLVHPTVAAAFAAARDQGAEIRILDDASRQLLAIATVDDAGPAEALARALERLGATPGQSLRIVVTRGGLGVAGATVVVLEDDHPEGANA